MPAGSREIQQSLVRKDLVRPAAEDTYRFKHLLLRDAAYEALPKEQRADLHERFADWIAENAPGLEEILGYHLEQAYGYRAELGPVDAAGRDLARRASALLASAGRRAEARSDVPATINLLERAVKLLPDGDAEAVAIYPDLGTAVAESGDLPRAEDLYRRARELGDPRTALIARQRGIWNDLMRGGSMAVAVGPIEETVEEAERLGDVSILAEGLTRLGVIASWLGENDRALTLLRRAVADARTSGDPRILADATRWVALVLLWGSTPVGEALPEVRRLAESTGGAGFAYAELLVVEGTLLALTGDFEGGRALAAEGRRQLLELGQKVQYAGIGQPAAILELLAGDAPAAERIMREAREILDAAGERGFLSTVSALLGLAVARQGRYDEADRFADESREAGSDDDVVTQTYWRIVKTNVEAAKGNLDEAARLAAEVVELTNRTDDTFDGPIALMDVIDFLDPARHRPVLERALDETARKGNVVSAEQIRAKLAALP